MSFLKLHSLQVFFALLQYTLKVVMSSFLLANYFEVKSQFDNELKKCFYEFIK